MALFLGFVIFEERGHQERSIGALLMVLGPTMIFLVN